MNRKYKVYFFGGAGSGFNGAWDDGWGRRYLIIDSSIS
jgi:hypothetical protein